MRFGSSELTQDNTFSPKMLCLNRQLRSFQDWINQRDGLGRTPLMLACASGSEARTQALLERGARLHIDAPFLDIFSIFKKSRSGLWHQNAMHELAARGHHHLFDLIVRIAGLDAIHAA